MCRVLALCFLFGIAFFNSVQSKQICKFSDEACLTKVAKRTLDAFRYGWTDKITPFDPLYVEKISGKLATADFELTDVYLKGLSSCNVLSLKFDETELKYDYRVQCPQLVFSYNEKLRGIFAGIFVDEEGPCFITAEDYIIIIKGEIEKYISEEDHELRFRFKGYTVETEIKGKLEYNNDHPIKGDPTTSFFVKNLINSNWKKFEEFFRSPILETFLKIFIKAHDTYVTSFPFNELFWDGQE